MSVEAGPPDALCQGELPAFFEGYRPAAAVCPSP
ncbi:hypothetical protein GGE35_003830 [Rhizobium cellulosilyticum]|uniref:Uncharacterized protein n=1 Tax=Aliirhizobium cellulosilyticum TaxID=393664 RepID=A0A7W6Y598_9HYPH|nr:hypothetical protein [Rhizobium cellulosilyticum]MBB4413068.1 hypothetical protein [Rhizobium cellulosilyticum]MBB4447995.1 hypothetical protein [Rhizobium cellulosilyticum]